MPVLSLLINLRLNVYLSTASCHADDALGLSRSDQARPDHAGPALKFLRF